MDIKQVVSVVKLIEPTYWERHHLTVIGDGYLEDGTRVHVVKDDLVSGWVMLSNAIVISEATYNAYLKEGLC